MENEMFCKYCGEKLETTTETCPKCGKKLRIVFYKSNWFMWIMLLICVPIGLFLLWKYCDTYSKKAKIIITVIFSLLFIISINKSNIQTDTNNNKTNTVKTTTATTTVKKPSVPIEYRNALKKAELYSNQMHLSKQGIYEQLTSQYGEGFSTEAAKYAIENIKADWNKNALEKAKLYSNQMSMSKNAIFEQLCSPYGEKFTKSEAQYAVDNLYK